MTAIEMADLLRQLPKARLTGSARPTDAEARPAQGLARARHPRAVRGRRPRRAAHRPTSTYRASIADPRIDEVRILRPQEIPRYVAEGLFDLGITGRDWIEETGSDVVSLCQLHYSKATARPVQIVVAVHARLGRRVASRT